MFKSSFSGASGKRVPVRFADDGLQMRDGKAVDGPVWEFNRGEWDAFLLGTFNGEFEIPL